jgi:nitrogen fixation NifU-like protein
LLNAIEYQQDRAAARVLEFVASDLAADGRADTEFFPEFSAQCRFELFARLHLTAWELPLSAMGCVGKALADEDAAFTQDDCRYNDRTCLPACRTTTLGHICILLEQTMYSERLLDHFQNPRNVGELEPPAVTIEVTNPICGDILRLAARMEGGVVREVRYKVKGCTASIAAGSALTEWMLGRSAGELRALRPGVIEKAVGGLGNESKHAAVLCVDGIKALLG